ncbi:MAG: glycosyltransferase family 4 protein [Beijerinckiaceae bacterium]|jgi:alpha-maltose-1-phosphate synthase|nr:glycosyltransferase family 4 protein [Beijerinckiaceae bacterium]
MPDQAPFAIFYDPDGYDIENHPLMGRRAAGKSFLNAVFQRYPAANHFCFSASKKHFEHFLRMAQSSGATGRATWLRADRPELLAQAGQLYFPGPDIGLDAWRRYRRDPRGWSIIGVTHTICTKTVMDAVAEWATAPLEDWDAVICTSPAVRGSVEYLLERQCEYLAERTGATRFSRPHLPVIPLGIETEKFAADTSRRARLRQRLSIGDEDVATLYVGRLSIFGKAHPLPMFIAMERAARASGKILHFIMAGWFATDAIKSKFQEFAAEACPSVQVHFVDGRNEADCGDAWQAADIFLSLVDNIQETFGLTPVEAMAAGLPAVISDWNGYRDTVRHGVDGFRVPTTASPSLTGESMIDRYAAGIDSYDAYLARTSYCVAVDIEIAAQRLTQLINSKELRQTMGAAGRERARQVFDWATVLTQYEELSAALAKRRLAAPPTDPKAKRIWPARLSPFELFNRYPTRFPGPGDLVKATADQATIDRLITGDSDAALALVSGEINASLHDPQHTMQAARHMLGMLADGEIALGTAVGEGNAATRMERLGTILRLAKFGAVSIKAKDGKNEPRPGVIEQQHAAQNLPNTGEPESAPKTPQDGG